MGKNEKRTSGAGEVQVFELTMDNPEDQDELNRRLRKPGENALSAPAKFGDAENSPPTGAKGQSTEKE
jgi:hypothetical protein